MLVTPSLRVLAIISKSPSARQGGHLSINKGLNLKNRKMRMRMGWKRSGGEGWVVRMEDQSVEWDGMIVDW